MVIRYSRKKKLSGEKRQKFQILLKRILRENTSREMIVDMDKLYHKILLALGYEGTFGEILKAVPNEIWDIDKVWEIHKLRNKIVHDFDDHDERFLRKKVWEYRKQLEILLENTK